MKMVKKIVELTPPQLHAARSKPRLKYLNWGRGAGKSTILGWFARSFVTQMPRASFFLAGVTYSQILSKTLPSTLEGLEMWGIYQDVDFVVGRSGKKYGFEMPYQPPNQWNNIIHFSNGAIFQLVSLDNPDSGRGLNSYGGMADEAALLDKDRLYNNVQATNRAKKEIFKNCSMLGAEVYASSMPLTKKGKWFLEMRQKAKTDPDFYWSQASALSNPHNRLDWFKKMRDNAASQMLYEAEILNIEPKEITDGFYANLNPDKHYYSDYNNSHLMSLEGKQLFEKADCRQDNDLYKNEPLIVSLDFGVFNSLVVSQMQTDINTYRVLKSMWAKSPKLLDDLILEQFIPYYRPHQDKTIYLYGGHDGHNNLPNSSRTLFEQVADILRAHDWSVYILAKKSAPAHARKYLLLNAMLKERNHKLPKIRINEHNNSDLIIALERTEAKEGTNGIEKEKKDERNKSMLQQHTTHLTDAFDMPLYDRFWDTFNGSSIGPGEGMITFG